MYVYMYMYVCEYIYLSIYTHTLLCERVVYKLSRSSHSNRDRRRIKGEGFSGTSLKNSWTKPRESGIRGGRWGWLGCRGDWWGVMETTVLEQRFFKK